MTTPKSVFAHAQAYFVKMTKYKVVPKKKIRPDRVDLLPLRALLPGDLLDQVGIHSDSPIIFATHVTRTGSRELGARYRNAPRVRLG